MSKENSLFWLKCLHHKRLMSPHESFVMASVKAHWQALRREDSLALTCLRTAWSIPIFCFEYTRIIHVSLNILLMMQSIVNRFPALIETLHNHFRMNCLHYALEALLTPCWQVGFQYCKYIIYWGCYCFYGRNYRSRTIPVIVVSIDDYIFSD